MFSYFKLGTRAKRRNMATTPVPRRQLSIAPATYFLIGGLAFSAMLFPGELGGWLLILISYLMIIASRTAQRHKRLFGVLIAIITARCFITLLDVYAAGVQFTVDDAVRFHRVATEYAGSTSRFWDWSGQLGASFYDWFLSRWYVLFGAHLLVGQAASTMAFLGFSILMYRVALLLGVNRKDAAMATLLFGLLPSAVWFTSITLREPWKLFFLALLVYSSLRYFRNPRLRHLLLWILSSLCLVLFHKAFGVLVPLLLLFPFLFLSPMLATKLATRKIGGTRLLVIAVLFMGVVWLGFTLLSTAGYWTTQALLSGDILTAAEQYRGAGIARAARATYGIALDTGSASGMILTLPLVYVYYLAAPFLWQIQSVIDVYAFIDALIGLIFLLGALSWYRQASVRRQKSEMRYLLVVFFAVSLVHALGTTNYGTSIRHRLLTSWITFILGWPIVIPRARRILRFGK